MKTLELMPWNLAILQTNYDYTKAGAFSSLTRTPDETSVVCEESVIPEGVECEKGFRALRFAGTLDFSLVGIVAKLSAVLEKEKISIFVISTYDTDYILLQESELTKAIDALQKHGYNIRELT